ncbi:MAG: putative RDD family membrane protein YckC [Verrucomicrobiales bacterium]|jgi:uncharacterized RDD family membrane protein YckC
MSWFYSYRGKQKGPVPARDLLVLESSGLLTGSSNIWAEGMPGWKTLDSVREQVDVEMGGENLAEFGVCAHSREVRPREEMIGYGDDLIAAEHKDAFLQSLHEGSTLDDQLLKGEMRYVGFWWRVLASIIDGLIKGAINMMFMIPFLLVAIPAMRKLSNDSGQSDPDTVAGVMVGMLVAYLLLFLATILSSLAYEVWMVGKYGGTVGKLALRFRVVNADGTKLSYGKSFARWASEVLSKFIFFGVSYGFNIMIIVMLGLTAGAMSNNEPNVSPILGAGMGLVGIVIAYAAAFPWWIAAHTKQKKALHDFICGTRVVFK